MDEIGITKAATGTTTGTTGVIAGTTTGIVGIITGIAIRNPGITTGITGIIARITGITAFAEIDEPRDMPTIYGPPPPRHDAETHGDIGRSWPAVGIVSIARYLAACGFRPKECHEAYVLVQLAHHDLEHDHNLNRRLMGSFLASLHPESAPRKALERVSLHDLMGHRDAGMVLFDAPMFQLVCSQCGRSEAGSDLALHEMGADKVCGLSKMVWAQQGSPQACTEEVFGLQELRVGNGVEGWLASTIPGGDPSKPRRLLLCASPNSSASRFARGRCSTLAITSSSNDSGSAPIRRSKRANM
ncbi:hypothetical protein PG990_010515 [Apiospora arundinis]